MTIATFVNVNCKMISPIGPNNTHSKDFYFLHVSVRKHLAINRQIVFQYGIWAHFTNTV